MLVVLMSLALSTSYYATPTTVVTDAPVAFGYDAVGDSQTRRKQPGVDRRSEDRILNEGQREQVTENSRDIHRNFSLVQWAIRRHLDYVTTFDFYPRNKDEGLNADIRALMTEWSKSENCDVAKRHTLARIFRMLEARATVDHDCMLAYVDVDGGRLQGIEGDRIRQPLGVALDISNEWVHGVRVNAQNEAIAYAVHKRTVGGGFEFEREVSAANAWLHGTFDRFDQVRGISPIISALNQFRDVYENFEFALAKAKVCQLFGLAFFDEDEETAGEQELDSNGQPIPRVKYGKAPFNINMAKGTDVKVLESDQPGPAFQDFTRLVVMVALKALDIPYSFFDEAHTNFFGSRGSWMHYDRSAQHKRDAQIEMRDDVTLWRYRQWIRQGILRLPRKMTVLDLCHEWVPMGMPWWDPSKEINGALQECGAGFNNPYRICKERGTGDFEENLREIARAKKAAEALGITLNFSPHSAPINVVEQQTN